MTTWQFVADMASDTPAVLLDLNMSPITVAPGYTVSPASYDKSYRGGALMHGKFPVRSSAQNRFLHLPMQIIGSTAALHSGAIQSLGLMLAVDGILKYQPNNSVKPVFFKTFGDPEYAAEVRGILSCAVQYQVITLDIEAEPFSLGPRVEVTGSPFTVSNNPAAVANPCSFDVTGVQGDVETPLLILATGTGTGGLVSKTSHFATRRRGVPGNYSNTIQAEDMTNGTDAADAVDANYSAGNKVTVSFATATAMTLRLSDTFPGNGTPTVEARGEYRVYARMAKTTAGDVIKAQLRYGTSSSANVSNDEVTLAATTNPYWVDLGKMPVPTYSDGVTMGYSGISTKVLMAFVGLYLQRVSGSGSVHIDALYFMPADEPTTLIAKFPSTDTTYAIDGTTDAGGACYALATTLDEQLTIASPVQITGGGGFPQVIPGATNRIHFLRHVNIDGSLDGITNTTALRVFYWPRMREAVRL